MFAGNQFDGGASLFSGGAFMPSQSTQAAADSASKNRANQSAMPLTVKQITEAYHYSEDKSNFFVDGVEITNVRLVGLVMNKVERVTDVSFSLDDGTGRIDISRWVNEAWDANEVTAIQNGMYVKVSVQMKGFQGKRHAFAFSVRPVIDFDEIALHFIECIYIHLENSRMKGGAPAKFQTNPMMSEPFPSGMKGYQAPMSNQFQAYQGMDGSENDVHRLVLGVFQEPAMLDYMWTNLSEGWVFRRIRSWKLYTIMLMWATSIRQLMNTTSSQHAMADVSWTHLPTRHGIKRLVREEIHSKESFPATCQIHPVRTVLPVLFACFWNNLGPFSKCIDKGGE